MALCAALLTALCRPGTARAQLPPVLRNTYPAHVAPGEALVHARAFAAARAGSTLLLAYIEDSPTGHGILRLARLQSSPRGGLERTGDDALIAPSARALALAWDGARGALGYIVPRSIPPPSPGARAAGRRSYVLPPSPQEPLGPVAPSGGEVLLQRLDGHGAPVGPATPVFTEHSRVFRVAVALEDEGAVVAWSGAAVTDDEVRGTVRALRVDAAGRRRSFASNAGFFGAVGDTLRVARVGSRTLVAFTGERCRALEGQSPPAPFPGDPSIHVESPRRPLLSQTPPSEVAGPPIECAPLALHVTELRPDDTFAPVTESPALAADSFALAGAVALAPVGEPAALVELGVLPGSGPPTPWLAARVPGLPLPVPTPPSLAPRARPPREPPGSNVLAAGGPAPAGSLVVERLVPPPSLLSPAEALHRPARVEGSPAAFALVTPSGADVLWVLRASAQEGPTVSALASAGTRFADLAVLPGVDNAWVLALDATWSGPVLLLDPSAPAAPRVDPAALDATYAQLFLRARIARSLFNRHENLAVPLGARPDAPTSPRIPGIMAVRNRLRSRWEAACAPLLERARSLVRRGASADLLAGAQQVCEIPGDIRLGVPIDPNL